jgi:hypothetical protein
MILVFSSCSHGDSGNPLYGQLENIREFGTVISVQQGTTTSVNAAGSASLNAAAGTGSSLFGIGNQSGGNTMNGPTLSAGTINTLHYVIQKQNGEIIHIDQEPEDVENRRQ